MIRLKGEKIFAKAEFLNPGGSSNPHISRDFGLLVGISSGANVWAARHLSTRLNPHFSRDFDENIDNSTDSARHCCSRKIAPLSVPGPAKRQDKPFYG